MLTEVKEGFYAQLKVVFDKLTGAENKLRRSPQEINQSKKLPEPQAVPSFSSSLTRTKTEEKLLTEVLKVTGGHLTDALSTCIRLCL